MSQGVICWDTTKKKNVTQVSQRVLYCDNRHSSEEEKNVTQVSQRVLYCDNCHSSEEEKKMLPRCFKESYTVITAIALKKKKKCYPSVSKSLILCHQHRRSFVLIHHALLRESYTVVPSPWRLFKKFVSARFVFTVDNFHSSRCRFI